MKSIEQIWNDLSKSSPPAYLRVDESHKCDLYAGLDESSCLALLLICKEEPPTPPDYDAVRIKVAKRVDGRWALTISLSKTELKPIYISLCEDLVESSRTLTPSIPHGGFFIQRVARWRRLLELGGNGILPMQELRGLIGELTILNKWIIPSYGVEASIDGWGGPLDAPQDFNLPDTIFEVKSTRPGATSVRISSVLQLGEVALKLILAVIPLSLVGPHTANSFSVTELVETTRLALDGYERSTLEFETRLLAVGYIDNVAYNDIRFLSGNPAFYEVTEEFPRLTKADQPAGILDVKYDIDLVSCTKHIVSLNGVDNGTK